MKKQKKVGNTQKQKTTKYENKQERSLIDHKCIVGIYVSNLLPKRNIKINIVFRYEVGLAKML